MTYIIIGFCYLLLWSAYQGGVYNEDLIVKNRELREWADKCPLPLSYQQIALIGSAMIVLFWPILVVGSIYNLVTGK